jgi:hypothetical protein
LKKNNIKNIINVTDLEHEKEITKEIENILQINIEDSLDVNISKYFLKCYDFIGIKFFLFF